MMSLNLSEADAEPFVPVPASDTPCTPTDSDVLCGRGGGINTHPGNETYRHYVERRKRIYLTARFKREKRLIAETIVKEIRNQNPPGRFLLRDGKDGPWLDIGDIKARDKTSQALRENAPKVRKQMEAENAARKEEERKLGELAHRDGDDANRNAQAKAIADREGAHGTQPAPVHAAQGQQQHQPHEQGWGYHYGPPPPRLMGQYSSSASSGNSNGSPQQQQQQQQQQQPQYQQQPQAQQHVPYPSQSHQQSAYPYGIAPQDNKAWSASVFDTVTSAFGLGPAQVAPMPQSQGQPQQAHHPYQQQQQHLAATGGEITAQINSVNEAAEVDKLMEEMTVEEDDFALLDAMASASPSSLAAAEAKAQTPLPVPDAANRRYNGVANGHSTHRGSFSNQLGAHAAPPAPQAVVQGFHQSSTRPSETQYPFNDPTPPQQHQRRRHQHRTSAIMDNLSSAPSSISNSNGSRSGDREAGRSGSNDEIAPLSATPSHNVMDDKSTSSGLFNIAQHILFSWDGSKSITTATKGADNGTQRVEGTGDGGPTPAAAAATSAAPPGSLSGDHFSQYRAGRDEDEVSEEGQEVELLELEDMEEDMPPPAPLPASSTRRRRLSIGSTTMRRTKAHMATRDFEGRTPPPGTSDVEPQKEIGGCHSWLQDSIKQNLPTNVFLGNGPQSPGGHSLGDGMMEGVSLCGTEFSNLGGSVGTSLGGQSLVGVFDNDTGSFAGSRKGSQGRRPSQVMMGPPLSPMVTGNRNRTETDRSVYSLGTKNSILDCDHSMMSAKSDNKSISLGSHHHMGLALSPSTESALGAISGPEDLGMDGPTIKVTPANNA